MSREITVVTPENVTIEYELAGLGSRAAAQLADLLVQIGFFVVLGLIWVLILSLTSGPGGGMTQLPVLADIWIALAIIVSFLIFTGYFIFFETTQNGQTPGKKWLGLRVIKEGGAPVDFASASIRNIIRIFEFALGSYVISLFFILFSPMYKRLGDYAAGTIVVKERSPSTVSIPSVPAAAPAKTFVADTREAAFMVDAQLLDKSEIEAIKRFVERRAALKDDIQEHLAAQMAQPIMTRLGMPLPSPPFKYVDYIELLYSHYVEERGVL
ncbi:MAG: RDD family protein [Armatimonadota bacterium]